MGRSPCCSNDGLNKGTWTPHEDKILIDYIKVHGEGRWRSIPKRAGLKRCGKSCRLRWLNYLRPDIKRGNISSDEEDLIIRLHNLLGNRWSLIAGRLPGRTDNEIKNYWNNHLGKKVKDGHQITTNAKSIENPKSKPPPKVKVTTIPSKLKLENHVVLQKTNKCSSVLINNPLPKSSMQFQNMQNAEDGIFNNDSICHQIEPNNNSSFLSFINEEKEVSTNFLKDFMDREDICLSDILNSDFSNMCDHFSNNEDLLLSSSDKFLVLSDETLMEWTQSSLVDETNVSNRE